MTRPQTADQWREIVLRVIETKGADFVYPYAGVDEDNACTYTEIGPSGCVYVPSCIVGHAFAEIDPDYVGWLYQYAEGLSADDAVLEAPDLPQPSVDAVQYLVYLQQLQDSGVAWGRAEELAWDSRGLDSIQWVGRMAEILRGQA